MSTPPVSGYYAVTCQGADGIDYTSADILYSYSATWVQKIIQDSIPWLANNVEILNDYKYWYRENGISFLMHFTGINFEAPLCTIHSGESVEDPLAGNEILANSEVL
jgi:hypothetical protein